MLPHYEEGKVRVGVEHSSPARETVNESVKIERPLKQFSVIIFKKVPSASHLREYNKHEGDQAVHQSAVSGRLNIYSRLRHKTA